MGTLSYEKFKMSPMGSKAKFKCDDGECREWTETRYKYIEVTVVVEEDIDCYQNTTFNTYGMSGDGGCSCEDDYLWLERYR